MKILNCEPQDYSIDAREILKNICSYSEANPQDRLQLAPLLSDTDGIISRLKFKWDKELLSSAPKVKFIATATTGLDHIDLNFCASRGIKILSLKSETEFLRSIPATAELTWGLLLCLTRQIPAALKSTLNGQWNRDEFKGRDLANKTIGICGLGRIGEKIARYAQAFSMRVQAYDPYRPDWVNGVKKIDSLSDFLSTSQILTLHIPLDEKNKNFIGAKEIAQLPPKSFLINTSRGQILDETACVNALKSGHLAGAALDVLSDETEYSRPLFANLREYAELHPHLIISPHIGGASFDSMAATEIFIAKKISAFIHPV